MKALVVSLIAFGLSACGGTEYITVGSKEHKILQHELKSVCIDEKKASNVISLNTAKIDKFNHEYRLVKDNTDYSIARSKLQEAKNRNSSIKRKTSDLTRDIKNIQSRVTSYDKQLSRALGKQTKAKQAFAKVSATKANPEFVAAHAVRVRHFQSMLTAADRHVAHLNKAMSNVSTELSIKKDEFKSIGKVVDTTGLDNTAYVAKATYDRNVKVAKDKAGKANKEYRVTLHKSLIAIRKCEATYIANQNIIILD